MTSPYLTHAVERLFARLTAVYGREFSGKWDGTTVDAVKAAWAHELRGFTHQLDSVAWALDHLPEKCPNAVQFKNLCRQAPDTRIAAMLPAEAAVRGPTPQEREVMGCMADEIRRGEFFAKPSSRWAYLLLERHERGERVSSYGLRIAREVVSGRALKGLGITSSTEQETA